MSDDLVALKVLIVSDSAAERDSLRSAASEATAVIDVAEINRVDDPAPACDALGNGVDVVFLDSRMAHDQRQAVINAARSASARPLVVSLGSMNSQGGDGLAIDGLLAKPIQPIDARM